ncbi:MAG: hypothetical protein QF466_07410 [Desulfobacterales bacterium]|nr:hypothetical protein [Desulfobacterales bacterium]MDP6682557.1 hypothetical protein [Desulfobacterales bacterium]MDP6807933.1 hypothetical protein [Desulfobacterales bacterium]
MKSTSYNLVMSALYNGKKGEHPSCVEPDLDYLSWPHGCLWYLL